MIKSKRKRCSVHVTCMGDTRKAHDFGWKPKGRGYLEDLGIDGMIMLKWILRT
jgi:hypothetical protein